MSRAELCRALAAVVAGPGAGADRAAEALGLPRTPTAADHTETFAFQLHPYASVHLGAEGGLGGPARDRIAGFFRALDVTPPPEPDHLAVLLDAYAQLLELGRGEADARARHAATVLLHEHLVSWVGRFTGRVAELGAAPYRRWARLLDDLLDAEVDRLGPAPVLPAHLRVAPGLEGMQDASPGALVGALLAPVRSGLVLARADLGRAADELDLGLRIGERAYMLRALLEQDPAATLDWLRTEAQRQHGLLPGSDDAVTSFWRGRLTASASLLGGLRGVAVAG